MKWYLKSFSLLIIVLMVGACTQVNRVGSVVIHNQTGERIFAQTRFLYDHSLSKFYALQPNSGMEIAKFDIAPGTESNVLIQLEEMQLSKAGCDINLDYRQIERLARLERPGFYIRITKDLFERCRKPEPDLEMDSLSG